MADALRGSMDAAEYKHVLPAAGAGRSSVAVLSGSISGKHIQPDARQPSEVS